MGFFSSLRLITLVMSSLEEVEADSVITATALYLHIVRYRVQ